MRPCNSCNAVCIDVHNFCVHCRHFFKRSVSNHFLIYFWRGSDNEHALIAKKEIILCPIFYGTHMCVWITHDSLSLLFSTQTDEVIFQWHFHIIYLSHSKSTNLICGHGRLINNSILLGKKSLILMCEYDELKED